MGLLLGLPLGLLLKLGLMLKLSRGTPGCPNHAPVLRPMEFRNTVTKMTLYMYINKCRAATWLHGQTCHSEVVRNWVTRFETLYGSMARHATAK